MAIALLEVPLQKSTKHQAIMCVSTLGSAILAHKVSDPFTSGNLTRLHRIRALGCVEQELGYCRRGEALQRSIRDVIVQRLGVQHRPRWWTLRNVEIEDGIRCLFPRQTLRRSTRRGHSLTLFPRGIEPCAMRMVNSHHKRRIGIVCRKESLGHRVVRHCKEPHPNRDGREIDEHPAS